VKDPQDEDHLAVAAVLNRMDAAEHGKDEFAVHAALSHWSPYIRVPPEQLGPRDQLARDAAGEFWIALVKEVGKPLKIVERIN
jgi:hypothetical protein